MSLEQSFASKTEVSPAELYEIAQLGMEYAPLEACGILVVGVGLTVVKNSSTDPANNSVMMVDDMLDGMIKLGYFHDANSFPDPAFVGKLVFWHTHPGGQVGPSAVDMIARENNPGLRMIVVAIPRGEVVEY